METLHTIYHPTLPPILAELAGTPPLLRLREIGMNCGCEYTAFPRFRGGRIYNRYLHSLGVGRIVWHFTEDPAQAAAGLLHDVATPPFAHVVDFLRGDHLRQEATEAGTRELIAGSPALQGILAACGLTTDQVADYHIYPIADNDSPRLSADRLEYTLGNALNYGFAARETLACLYRDLTVGVNEDGAPELCFRRRETGLAFARLALRCSRVYVSPEDRYAMQALSELLGRALDRGILTEAELRGTEPALIARLAASDLAPEWNRFCAMSRIRTAEVPPDDRPWRQVPAKKRYVDPLILGQGRASALDPNLAAELSAYLSEPQTAWLLGE